MNTAHSNSPRFPALLSLPFKLMPVKLHSNILIAFLNKLFAQAINEGDLDFLKQKRLCVKVSDAGVIYYISLLKGRLIPVLPDHINDLIIQANLYDFLSLAARQEDPDALVFQRRLVMEGDTELGLELKNFLDGLDIESMGSFVKIETILQKSLPVYRRLFS